MVLKIRLSRFGRRHSPVYNIVLTHARTAPKSKPLEVLGTYDPNPQIPLATEDPEPDSTTPSSSSATTGPLPSDTLPMHNPNATASAFQASRAATVAQRRQGQVRRYKKIEMDTSRIKYWLGVGAQPSDTVERLLAMYGLLEPKPGRTKLKEVS